MNLQNWTWFVSFAYMTKGMKKNLLMTITIFFSKTRNVNTEGSKIISNDILTLLLLFVWWLKSCCLYNYGLDLHETRHLNPSAWQVTQGIFQSLSAPKFFQIKGFKICAKIRHKIDEEDQPGTFIHYEKYICFFIFNYIWF